MASYQLSPQAEQDLLNIALYGLERFGLRQAERYQETLQQRLDELAEHPLRVPAVEHIRPGYRRSVCGAHSIYYRIEREGIVIMRILGRQDLGTAL